jgi:uncharacterized protein (DUF58 family)
MWQMWRRLIGLDQSRWPRQLKMTREGKLLILITIGLGFAAINTGNNLLYLILGMLLSLIVVSGILSELCLQGIVVRRRYSDGIHAGVESFLALEITNTKKRMNSFCLEVEETYVESAPIFQRPAYSLSLGPGETKTVAIRVTFGKRGLWKSTGLKIATRFPFSFFSKSRIVSNERELLVFPAIHDVAAPYLIAETDFGTEEIRPRIGQGPEYHGLREYTDGDDPRDIHWKSTARLGKLISREYEAEGDRTLWLYIANWSADELEEDAMEAAIEETASLAVHYLFQGWAVGVCSIDGSVPPQAGNLNRLMTHLALLRTYSQPRPFAAIAQNAVCPPFCMLVRHQKQRFNSGNKPWDRVHEVIHAL